MPTVSGQKSILKKYRYECPLSQRRAFHIISQGTSHHPESGNDLCSHKWQLVWLKNEIETANWFDFELIFRDFCFFYCIDQFFVSFCPDLTHLYALILFVMDTKDFKSCNRAQFQLNWIIDQLFSWLNSNPNFSLWLPSCKHYPQRIIWWMQWTSHEERMNEALVQHSPRTATFFSHD